MKTLFWTLFSMAIGFSAPSCSSSKAENGKEKKPESRSVVYVKVEKIVSSDFAETIHLTGSIESQNNIIVPAEEGGRIIVWNIAKGGSVQAGQLLAQIDDAALKAGYAAALANFNMSEVNYQKQKAAYDEQAISALQLKNLEYQRDAAKAIADLSKIRLDKTAIHSPIRGILNNRFVDEGELIGPGMPIAQVIDMQHMKVLLGVPERYSKDLRAGLNVQFTVDAFPGEVFEGTVSFIASAVNPDNRSLPVEINFDNVQEKLKPQMIASVALRLVSSSKSILIPQDYVQQVDLGKTVVYVMNSDQAEERAVTLGGTDGALVRVISGLKEGDQIITVGFQNLIDKQKVVIQN